MATVSINFSPEELLQIIKAQDEQKKGLCALHITNLNLDALVDAKDRIQGKTTYRTTVIYMSEEGR